MAGCQPAKKGPIKTTTTLTWKKGMIAPIKIEKRATCPLCGKDVGKLPDYVIARMCSDCTDKLINAICKAHGIKSLDEF